jgi:hypothetical protein
MPRMIQQQAAVTLLEKRSGLITEKLLNGASHRLTKYAARSQPKIDGADR